ncbi:MAG TPA: DUF6617 family protein [Prolixibacteraceae bacterium]|jgi:hypothetical protein
MNSDISLKFERHFEEICRQAMKEAIAQAEWLQQSLQLDTLSPRQKGLVLGREFNLNKQQLIDFQRREYFHLADDPQNLYKYFSTQLVFRHQNEAIYLREAIILNEKHKLLTRLLKELNAQPETCLPANSRHNNHPPVIDRLSIDQVFDQTCQQGLIKGKQEVADYQENHPSKGLSRGKYHSILSSKMNQLRSPFTDLENPQYYYLLNDHESLKNFFAHQCQLDPDIGHHRLELQKALSLHAMVDFLTQEQLDLDENVIKKALDTITCHQTLTDILCSMCPSGELIEQLMDLLHKTVKEREEGKPVLLLKKDMKEVFDEIFQQAYPHLKATLDQQPVERKCLFIKCMLLDMVFKKNRARRHGRAFSHYYDQLIELFESEMRYIESVKIYNHLTVEDILYERKEPAQEACSFGCKKSREYLLPLIKDLNLKINLLDPRTSPEDCVQILMAADLSLVHENIYLGCKTTEFTYVVKKYLKPMFKSFNPASIGRSGIFISNTGTPISASNLNSAKFDGLKTRYGIDHIFNNKK